MKRISIAVLLAASACGAWSQGKGCESLKAAVEAKLIRKGVQHYSLNVVPVEEEREGRVVGRCDGGTRKLVYRRDTRS